METKKDIPDAYKSRQRFVNKFFDKPHPQKRFYLNNKLNVWNKNVAKLTKDIEPPKGCVKTKKDMLEYVRRETPQFFISQFKAIENKSQKMCWFISAYHYISSRYLYLGLKPKRYVEPEEKKEEDAMEYITSLEKDP